MLLTNIGHALYAIFDCRCPKTGYAKEDEAAGHGSARGERHHRVEVDHHGSYSDAECERAARDRAEFDDAHWAGFRADEEKFARRVFLAPGLCLSRLAGV